ncbi:hypothetical protein FRB93_012248 [Tulasnella sp. JGI-2019a]|nr:hypothetical protein FRB93_012248 [Tulasnella sp. JGI-2019a]
MAGERLGIETINFKEHTDVVNSIYEMEHMGLDVALYGAEESHAQDSEDAHVGDK